MSGEPGSYGEVCRRAAPPSIVVTLIEDHLI
jgi:hypothetical protein